MLGTEEVTAYANDVDDATELLRTRRTQYKGCLCKLFLAGVRRTAVKAGQGLCSGLNGKE